MSARRARFRAKIILLAIGVFSAAACGVVSPLVPLALTARNIAFEPPSLEAPALAAFTIRFQNADAAEMLHTVEIRLLDGVTLVERQDAIPGGTTAEYSFKSLPPGEYVFICSIHPIPSMTGTLLVH